MGHLLGTWTGPNDLNAVPYTRKTTRHPRRHLITFDELERANQRVTTEMGNLGLWHRKLDSVDVWHVPASFSCYGWFRVKGDIYVPALTGAQLSDLLLGYHTRLSDVLRHEWAHALADRRPSLVKSRGFRQAFGGPYHSTEPVGDFDPEAHLTRYAASSPCEDFAETFHYFLRHKGRLPQRLQSKVAIVRKWRFLKKMAGG